MAGRDIKVGQGLLPTTQTTIHLDTKGATNGSISYPSWDSGNPMLDGADRVSVVSVEFPNTMYNITSSNNGLRIVNSTDAKTYNVTISPSFYDTTTIATAIVAALNAADGAVVWAMTYSGTSAKFTISNSSTKNIQLIYASSSIAPAIGFTSDSGVSTSITGDTLSALESMPFIYFRSNLTTCCIVNGVATTTLFAMQLTNPFGSTCFYRASALEPVLPLSVSTIGNIQFEVLDRNGVRVDTNGKHWKITLAVWKAMGNR